MVETPQSFDEKTFHVYCDALLESHEHIGNIHLKFGYPPMWNRPNNFSSLVKIVLEQQVSLASAASSYNKLVQKLGILTPELALTLDDEEMKSCFVSRQKASYIRDLSNKILSKELDLEKLETMEDATIQTILTEVKGIGQWTSDIFILTILNRLNIVPRGDVALRKSISEQTGLQFHARNGDYDEFMKQYHPYGSIATYYYYWAYINHHNKVFVP